MGKAILLIFGAAALCCLSGAEFDSFHYPDHGFDRTPLGDSVDRASMKLLKEAYELAEDKNVVSSPLGVLILLSLYSAGAGDENREEIVKALGVSNYSELVNSYSRLGDKYSSMDGSYMNLANKIYVSDRYELAEAFAGVARGTYHSAVEAINFNDPTAAAATINKWSNEQTEGNIPTPVSPDMLDSSTAAALFNVIYFKGHWNVPFQASETIEKDFHVDRSTVVKKPTMQLMQTFFYYESKKLGARLLELPYKESGFRMVIVLPDEIDGLPSVLEKVAQNGLLEDIFALEPSYAEIILEIPKFEIETGLDLNEILPKMGVSRIFTDGAPGIVRNEPVVVTKAFQKAFVKVDEEGATAGAFTGSIMVPYSSDSTPPPPFDYKVDHPFIFAILHEDTVLFTGTFIH